MKTYSFLVCIVSAGFLSSCGPDKYSYVILPEQNVFQQTSSMGLNSKYDILWVVDNSGSMQPFQQNLVLNFKSFVKNFVTLGFDFHIAVIPSDAYQALPIYKNDSSLSLFRDGSGNKHTGVYVINPTTPNVIDTFTLNATQGDAGAADERAFSSFKAALSNPDNSDFRRADAFLAIIILSDEDDFSSATRAIDSSEHDYRDPSLESVDSYISYLDNFTGSNSANRNYTVSTITVKDQACLQKHLADTSATTLGKRYLELTEKTGGVAGDICSSSFADVLDQLQGRIIELGSEFPLTRLPIPESIQVSINGLLVPKGLSNGWSYNSGSNSIHFHGTAIPPQDSQIAVVFDPATPK